MNVIVMLFGYHLIILHSRASILVSGLRHESQDNRLSTDYRLPDAERLSTLKSEQSSCDVTVYNKTFIVPMNSILQSLIKIECKNCFFLITNTIKFSAFSSSFYSYSNKSTNSLITSFKVIIIA